MAGSLPLLLIFRSKSISKAPGVSDPFEYRRRVIQRDETLFVDAVGVGMAQKEIPVGFEELVELVVTFPLLLHGEVDEHVAGKEDIKTPQTQRQGGIEDVGGQKGGGATKPLVDKIVPPHAGKVAPLQL